MAWARCCSGADTALIRGQAAENIEYRASCVRGPEQHPPAGQGAGGEGGGFAGLHVDPGEVDPGPELLHQHLAQQVPVTHAHPARRHLARRGQYSTNTGGQ